MERIDVEEVRQFLQGMSERGGADPTELFHEQFLDLDPGHVAVVTREQLRAALPARARLFAAVGARGVELRDLTVHPLDDAHLLARTVWDVDVEATDAPPLELHSSYLLRRSGERWQVVVYLNHQDLPQLLAGLSGSQGV